MVLAVHFIPEANFPRGAGPF